MPLSIATRMQHVCNTNGIIISVIYIVDSKIIINANGQNNNINIQDPSLFKCYVFIVCNKLNFFIPTPGSKIVVVLKGEYSYFKTSFLDSNCKKLCKNVYPLYKTSVESVLVNQYYAFDVCVCLNARSNFRHVLCITIPLRSSTRASVRTTSVVL